jgi:hypothetical protein
VPVLHGVRLLLDAASAQVLSPWLEEGPGPFNGPTIEIQVRRHETRAAPAIVDMLADERTAWLGRTATGLLVRNHEGSWLAIEGDPPVVRGVLALAGEDGATRDLLLTALLIALCSIGVYALHAAAICIDDDALVLLGGSGAGKSTTATALVSAGCRYLGDDGILIRERSGDVELRALWSSFRLTDQTLSSFRGLRPHVSKLVTDQKWKLDASSAFPDRQLAEWLGPKTLLFLGRSTQRASALLALSQAEAVGFLIAQSNALGLECHPNPRQHLDLLAQLTNRARIARLELGGEWLEDPLGAAGRLLEAVRSFPFRASLRREAS